MGPDKDSLTSAKNQAAQKLSEQEDASEERVVPATGCVY